MARFQETNERGYYRDAETGAVVNLNKDEYHIYKAAREKALKAQSLEQRVNGMSEDLAALKIMMGQVLTALQSK